MLQFFHVLNIYLLCTHFRWHNIIYTSPEITKRFPLKIEIDSLFGNSLDFHLASVIDKSSLKVSKVEILEDLRKYSYVKVKPTNVSFEVRENLRNILTILSESVLHLKVKEIHENFFEIILKQLPNLTHLEFDMIIFNDANISEIDFSRIKRMKIINCEWNSTKISPFDLLTLEKLKVIESQNILIHLKTSNLLEIKLDINLGVIDCSEIIKIIKSNKENLRKVSIKKCSNSELLSSVWNKTKLEKLSIQFSGLLKDCEIEKYQKDLKILTIYGSNVNVKVLKKIMRKAEGKKLFFK